MYPVDRTRRDVRPAWLAALGEWHGRISRRRARSVALAEVGACAEGELVRVRARVGADRLLAGALHGAPGVFRRLNFVIDGSAWVHQRGLDFGLVDDTGERILVCVGGGGLVVPPEELIEYPARCFAEFGIAAIAGKVLAREFVLTDGSIVEVLGHKTTVVDPSGAAAGYRGQQQRVALRSSREQPLLLVPAS